MTDYSSDYPPVGKPPDAPARPKLVVDVPHPRVVLYHQQNEPWQVLLYAPDDDRVAVAAVHFTGLNAQDLAYEYYKFKCKKEGVPE